MNSQKSPFRSVGVAGGAAAVIVGIGQLIGVAITPGDVNEAIGYAVSAATIVSGVAAMFGRVRANSTIRWPW